MKKKLLILTASVAVACGLHAAQYIWGLSSYDYQDHSGNPLETGTAFFYLGTVTSDGTAFDTSAATFITSGGFDAVNYGYGNLENTSLGSSDAITSTAAGQAYSIVLLEESNVSSLDGYEGYYTIVNGTSNAEGTIPGVTVTRYADFVNGTDSAYTTSLMTAPTPPEPPTPGVPEPTSGLLLVMGLAGLALKRKRA